MSKKRKWIVALALAAIVVAAAFTITASMVARRIEPLARQAAIQYLSQRFDSDVELRALQIHLPKISLPRMIWTRGRGITVQLEGQGLSMRLHSRPEAVPLFVIRQFHCAIKLDSLFNPPVIVPRVTVDGMEIQIPPRDEKRQAPSAGGGEAASPGSPGVKIGEVTIQNAALVLQPRDPRRIPLRFEIQRLQLISQGAGAPMKYDAALTNAKPPGKIQTSGAFGPWSAGEPGETPVSGDYRFDKADLGVFASIAGTLDSTGRFEGQLSALKVRGQASVPDFRLKMSGNPVPLTTRFTVLVDATNGNTTLEPVSATLGSTRFTTSGGIIKHEANQPRAISLNVSMPNGDLRDVLRLAMKGSPFMEGRLSLRSKIDIPPLAAKVRQKLVLDGTFEVHQAKFLHSTIQNQVDGLSRRARGEQENPQADTAVSQMSGAFHLENAAMRFSRLSFGIPGAHIALVGDYTLNGDVLNFGGTLALQATVSQIVGGWKGALLRPIDRFFEKDGAGTLLHIRVDGTSRAPKFGVVIAGRVLEAPLPKKR